MTSRPAVVFGLLRAGLAIVRGLGRAGVPVSGIAWRGNDFALSSRYVGAADELRGAFASLGSIRARL